MMAPPGQFSNTGMSMNPPDMLNLLVAGSSSDYEIKGNLIEPLEPERKPLYLS